jgi:hypothetical protein
MHKPDYGYVPTDEEMQQSLSDFMSRVKAGQSYWRQLHILQDMLIEYARTRFDHNGDYFGTKDHQRALHLINQA